jgi:hypothetical protein
VVFRVGSSSAVDWIEVKSLEGLSPNQWGVVGALRWADYDNDGILDVVVGGAYTQIYPAGAKRPSYYYQNTVYKFNGQSFTSTFSTPGTSTGCWAVWADFNLDTFLDLMMCCWINPTSCNAYTYNSTAGKFSSSFAFPTGSGQRPEVGDYNNDGKPDVLITIFSTKHVLVYQNLGNGGFAQAYSLVYAPSSPAVWGDYDSDGYLDFAFQNQTGYYVVRNVQNGFSNPIQLPGAGLYDTTGGEFLSWVDYDGDNHLDLTACPNDRYIYLFHNDVGAFSGPTIYATTYQASEMQWADYNGDSVMDLLLSQGGTTAVISQSSNIMIYDGQYGNNVFTLNGGTIPFGLTLYCTCAQWADINQDGVLEMTFTGMDQTPDYSKALTSPNLYGPISTWIFQSNLSPIPGAPAVPVNLRTTTTNNILNISWTAPSGAKGLTYEVGIQSCGSGGTCTGSSGWLVVSTCRSNGMKRIPSMGNAGPRTFFLFNIASISSPIQIWVFSVSPSFRCSNSSLTAQFSGSSSTGIVGVSDTLINADSLSAASPSSPSSSSSSSSGLSAGEWVAITVPIAILLGVVVLFILAIVVVVWKREALWQLIAEPLTSERKMNSGKDSGYQTQYRKMAI